MNRLTRILVLVVIVLMVAAVVPQFVGACDVASLPFPCL